MASEIVQPQHSPPANKFAEVAAFFLRLGLTGFGGPLALVAEMQKELIEKRQWISMEEFRQGFTVIKSMPGPLAYQVAIFMGYRRAGRWGGLLAGLLLLLPATVLMMGLGWAYNGISQNQEIGNLFLGFQMGALVLISLAIRSLTDAYLQNTRFWCLVTVSFLVLFFHFLNEPLMILLAALWSLFLDSSWRSRKPLEVGFSLALLVWICLKAGAIVFGTGLAIVPLLENDFVRDTGWITHQQFMDAFALGQLTPGPVLVTVTFVGFRLDGIRGALAATFAVFFPSTVNQLTWFPKFVGWMSQQKWIQSFVLGATAAITAGIAVAIVNIAREATSFQLALFAVFLLIAVKIKVPSWMLILLSGVCSWALLKVFS